MAGPFFDNGDDCMTVYRNTEDFLFCRPPYPRESLRSAGVYLQSTRPTAGNVERIPSGGTLPLETAALRWGRGIRWDNAEHCLIFSSCGLYEVQWILLLQPESARSSLVDLLDENGRSHGRSACRGSLMDGSAVVRVCPGMKLRLVNTSPFPLNLAALGTLERPAAGTLTAIRLE